MNMLITERAVITPQKTARVRPVVAPTPAVRPAPEVVAHSVREVVAAVVVKPQVQVNPIQRQNVLLLVLVLVPLVGAVANLLTYGLVR